MWYGFRARNCSGTSRATCARGARGGLPRRGAQNLPSGAELERVLTGRSRMARGRVGSATPGTGVSPMRRTLPTHLLVALLLCVAGCVSATRLSLGPPLANADTATPQGYLLIVGGGGTTANMYEKAIELGGGRNNARVVIFPQASELPETGESSATVWRDYVAEGQNVRGADRKHEKNTLELAEKATVIWCPGGVQTRVIEARGK